MPEITKAVIKLFTKLNPRGQYHLGKLPKYMIIHLLISVTAIALFYSLSLVATIPFLVYFGRPKKWQKTVQFLMSFPLDNETFGFFSLASAILFIFLNGLLCAASLTGIGGLIFWIFEF
jgi:uncharacterized protein YjeT (DUF2065 family)